MSNLDARIALQQSRFTLIQESTNLDDEHAPRSSRQLVNARLDMLERNWNKFQDEHENLRLSDNDALSEHSYLKERVYERCQAFYVYARAKLLTHLDEFDTTDRHSRTTLSDRGAFTSSMPRSALPRIRLPTFSGDYQSWKSFHDLFTSLIKDNPDLSTVEKMHYLKTCVTGEAARLVGNLSISGDNFSIAWDLLISRYENKRFLIASQLDRIMSLKPLKTKCAQGLRTLLTTISEATAALRSLGCTVSSWDPLLLHHLVKLLDPESREAWEVKLGLSTTYPTYVQFEEFLIGRTRAMENIGLTSTTGTPAATPFGKHRSRVAAHVAASTPTTSNSVCPLCGSLHSLAKCESYQNKTVQQRKDFVIRNRRCFNCLAPHPVRKCQTTKRCLKCGKKHHTSIHTVHNETSKAMHYASTSGTNMANPSEKKSEAPSPADLTGRLTLLATSRALLRTSNEEHHPVRLLIDQGSELSFITEDLPPAVKFEPSSCHALPPFNVNSPSWPHISGLQLADPDYSFTGPIHIIIGSDNYHAVIRPGLIPGDSSSPTAQQTIFGWVLCGPTSADDNPLSAQAYHCSPDFELQDLISRFWTQEELPNTTRATLNEEEEECEQHFLTTHSRNATGRYVVRLPLKVDPSALGESKSKALGCLRRLFQQFSSKSTYQQLYVDFINEYQHMGHMVEADTSSGQTFPAHYLPHHGVLRENHRTTKLRVVFNGSSRTSNGLSLNDILHAGAKLQTDMCEILLWTRTHRVLFSADIVKMFRQVAVHPDDWDLQRILWFGKDNQLIAYRLTTVTYGLNCAPFLALRTLQQLVKDEGHRFPKAVVPMTKGRYVDDIFGGADSSSEAKDIMQQLIQLCEAGGFPLLKWNSNRPEILPQSNKETLSDVEIEPAFCKILGLVWRPCSDTLHFSSTIPTASAVTKKAIASDIAKLYDPLGLISPILIRAKIILQELWLLKTGWDEPLPNEIRERWTTFRHQLLQIEQVSIPRWLGTLRSNASTVEIHGFSDASQLAMAAAVYIRIPGDEDKGFVQLICSKTRVAPLKRLTIPRLELTAALLLARLIAQTSKALELHEATVFCWSDSSVTLTWITAHPSRWKDFVRNRVSAIQEILPSGSWRYVPGKENPADLASRGLTPDQLIHHNLWWNGPKWLSESRTFWPSVGHRPAPNSNLEERPGHVMVTTSRPTYWELLNKYSSLVKLLRITATCGRFISCLRKVPQSSPSNYPLTPIEIQRSRDLWVKIVQQAWFREEIRLILREEQLPKSNFLVRLTPFIDKDGLLRVGGRLHYAQIDIEAKHQLILPRRSPLTTLVIGDAHRRSLHGGTQVTLSLLRETFWIIGGRAPVRSYILRCGRCARYRGIRARQLMGQLPTARVTSARPFYNSGLDYAGPVTLRTWRGRAARFYKGYFAIFVCLATSAVHIEVVTDYHTDAFIAAYKRFAGRRGICATLQSDCGTNFVGADVELKRLFAQSSKELGSLASLLANDGTEWRFNPPSAPHFGGKWEAAVKSVKFHLRRVLGDTAVTYEEMTTITAQIEAVLNSRPLCPLSDDVSDYSALTPGHFLIGEAPTAIPEPNLSTESMPRLTRWQLLRQRVEQFWSRWSSECLQRYQAISKWHHPANEIKEGTLVLITDERYPPGKWPLARVIQLHPGPDGLTRVVTLRTSTSTYKRPIAKLCVLPTDPDAAHSTTPSSKAGGNVAEVIEITDTVCAKG